MTTAMETKLHDIRKRKGYYSLKNLRRRETTANQKHIQNVLLKQELRMVKSKLEKKIAELEKAKTGSREQGARLYDTKRELELMKKNIADKDDTITKLKGEVSALESESKAMAVRAKSAQNAKHYIKSKNMNINDTHRKAMREKNKQIAQLEHEVSDRVTNQKEPVSLKDNKGAYTFDTRITVIELLSLEVAADKVPKVIQAVGANIFKQTFADAVLPCATTVINMADEGHFIAQSYISSRLQCSENWGLHKDGTSRRKRKLLDTSITISSGENFSLGFSCVARETGDAISTTTQRKLTELANTNQAPTKAVDVCNTTNEDVEDYMYEVLEKLSYYMSDRAANEKKSNKILNEWRDEVLSSANASQSHSQKVHFAVENFHCTAHVLLGFHANSEKELKRQQIELSASQPLGRDALPQFNFWRKDLAASRVVRTTSELFGPVGEHIGVRDLWEAHCAAEGIKSHIGNYRDNRFNCLFENASQIVYHHSDMLTVLSIVKTPNQKVVAVSADLNCKRLMDLVHALAIMHIHVTGPFWQMCQFGAVKYRDLGCSYIQPLLEFLEVCISDPSSIEETVNPLTQFRTQIIEVYSSKISIEDTSVLVRSTVSLLASAFKDTICKQLSDFVDGPYSQRPSEEQAKRTSFAPITNLSCEHHFGDLDSSQRRRPNASLHHHSTVQLLKRNRTNIVEWLEHLPETQRENIFLNARRNGPKLRAMHKLQDTEVRKAILHETQETTKPRKVAKTHKLSKSEQRQAALTEKIEDSTESLRQATEGDWVAVAYQEGYYTGIIRRVHSCDDFTVDFARDCRVIGDIQWPNETDVQRVARKFILKSGFKPVTGSRGRIWKIPCTDTLATLFKEFAEQYFI